MKCGHIHCVEVLRGESIILHQPREQQATTQLGHVNEHQQEQEQQHQHQQQQAAAAAATVSATIVGGYIDYVGDIGARSLTTAAPEKKKKRVYSLVQYDTAIYSACWLVP